MATLGLSKLISDIQAKYDQLSDPYFDQVSLLLKTNGAITDQSSNSRSLTLRGDVTQSSVQTKYANRSIYFDGTGDGIDVFDIPLIGTQQFTIEFWMYPDNPSGTWQTLVSNEYNAANCFRLYKTDISTELSWYNGLGVLISTSGAGLASQWHHIAVCRDSTNTTRVFVDGNIVGSASDTTNYGVLASSPVSIGLGNTTYEVSEYPYEGYMEDLRITIGVARYTADFTPPSKPLPIKVSEALTNLYNLTNKVSSGYKVNQLPPAASKQFGTILRVDDTYYANNGSDWLTIDLRDSAYGA